MITPTEAEERDYSILYLRHGIPEAFKVFFFEYYSELFSFAQMLLQHRAAARKVTMEAFFGVWDRRSEFESAKKIKAFLYLSVRNSCLLQLKSPLAGEGAPLAKTVPASLPPELLRELFAFATRRV